MVHDLHNRGGHAGYTKVLADTLSHKHDVTVFANHCERTPGALWSEHHVRASRGSALACVQTFPLGMKQLESSLEAFDIRHMQGYCGGRPNVVTAHICVAAYLASLRDISVRDQLSLKLMAAAEKRFYRRYDGRLIAISQKVARELRDLYEVQLPATIIPHGVDHVRFNRGNRTALRCALRKELGLSDDATIALYVGDLTKAHTHLTTLASAAPDVQFVVVTPSQKYHWTAPNVRILPPTAELPRYYAMADAFVFPTTYDAFGMVILEAMASGLAVFSSDCAGAAELITSGKDGFVFPLDDWVASTARTLADKGALEAVGSEAEKTAQRHPWSLVVEEVERVYFQATSNRN